MYCNGSGWFGGGFPWMGVGYMGWLVTALLVVLAVFVVFLLRRRPQKKGIGTTSCPHCAGTVLNVYLHCPHCGKVLKSHCPGCSRLVEHGWVYCPYCQQTLAAPTGGGGEVA